MIVKLKQEGKQYSLTNGKDNIASSFVGKVGPNVVHASDFMEFNEYKTLMGFWVKPEHQRRGYGTKLMMEIIEAERAKGTKYLNLGVAKDNYKAIELYEKCGFQIDGPLKANDKYHYMWIEL